jgi:hypothetical protein
MRWSRCNIEEHHRLELGVSSHDPIRNISLILLLQGPCWQAKKKGKTCDKGLKGK